MEEAIVRYYEVKIHLPEALRAEVRAIVDEAVQDDTGLSDDIRDQFNRRLEALDKKGS